MTTDKNRAQVSDSQLMGQIEHERRLGSTSAHPAAVVKSNQCPRDDRSQLVEIWFSLLLVARAQRIEEMIRKVDRDAPGPLRQLFRLIRKRPQNKDVHRRPEVKLNAFGKQVGNRIGNVLKLGQVALVDFVHTDLKYVFGRSVWVMFHRSGKRAAGREPDGRTHDEFPGEAR
ncbi:hypothetical protein F3J14_01045 [Burkholderia sp. Tr-862]|uniref:hypothetical protein n=1 Tax=Burkholderia sp. Tr-862 TaxID=2608331 RepID=UPI001419FBE5|nr:hypothetical protein [Burkholderia sp. Tr-862]NIF39512.1 hypothetical protein [Burkholderia sp. Tr-862]